MCVASGGESDMEKHSCATKSSKKQCESEKVSPGSKEPGCEWITRFGEEKCVPTLDRVMINLTYCTANTFDEEKDRDTIEVLRAMVLDLTLMGSSLTMTAVSAKEKIPKMSANELCAEFHRLMLGRLALISYGDNVGEIERNLRQAGEPRRVQLLEQANEFFRRSLLDDYRQRTGNQMAEPSEEELRQQSWATLQIMIRIIWKMERDPSYMERIWALYEPFRQFNPFEVAYHWDITRFNGASGIAFVYLLSGIVASLAAIPTLGWGATGIFASWLGWNGGAITRIINNVLFSFPSLIPSLLEKYQRLSGSGQAVQPGGGQRFAQGVQAGVRRARQQT